MGKAFALFCLVGAPLLMVLILAAPVWWRRKGIAAPQVGQVWVSRHSGHRIVVVEVSKWHNGAVWWVIGTPGNPFSSRCEFGLRNWREMIDTECRVLVEVPPTTEPAAAAMVPLLQSGLEKAEQALADEPTDRVARLIKRNRAQALAEIATPLQPTTEPAAAGV